MNLNFGRSWYEDELKLKSGEELHKLWYVLLREKNSILADSNLMKRTQHEQMPSDRINTIKTSMDRLLTVVEAREGIKKNYRIYLED